MPTPIATYVLKTTVPGTGALTTPSFTPSNGEDIVIKLGTWDTGSPMGAPTGGGQTYTSRVINAPGGFNEWCAIYTATISGSPGSMAISSTPSVSSQYSMCVERWPAGSLAASPVTNSSTGFSAAAASTITPTAGTSTISWVSGDAQSIDPATRAYLNSGTDEGLRDGHNGSNGVEYYGLQPASGTGSQSYGLSLPSGQTFVIAGIEVLATGGSTPIVDPTWTPHLLRPPSRVSPAGFWTPWSGDSSVQGISQVALSDTASETEALTVAATVPLADTGSETEALTVAAAVPLADGGSAADTLSVVVTVPLADSGSAADGTAEAVAAPLADTAAAADALGVAATIALNDTGSAADAVDNGLGTSKSLADSGSASDALTVTATVPLADAGAGTDSLSAVASVPLADAGSAAEALTVAATVPLGDAGSASDAVDNGTGTSKPIGDTGTAVDTLTVTVTLALADGGSAADSPAVGGAIPLADAAAAGQTFAAAAAVPLADSATSVEALSVGAVVSLADGGSAADAGTGQDNAFVTKNLGDAGHAADVLRFVPSLITGRPGVTGDPLAAEVTGDPGTASVTGVY